MESAREFTFPPELYHALTQLNAREYFECHETLEALWLAEKGEIREVYQGILQIAVGCYHLVERANYRGAVNKLNQGARKLARWPPQMDGVRLDLLIQSAERLRSHAIELGPDHISEYDRSLMPLIVALSLNPVTFSAQQTDEENRDLDSDEVKHWDAHGKSKDSNW